MNNQENVSKQELAFYAPMKEWFCDYLQNKNRNAEVMVHDIHKIYLSDFFTKVAFRKNFPDYPTYKIKIDLLGVVKEKDKYGLIFIEVKYGALNFSHLAQILVYSKLVRPSQAILISPQGLSVHLNNIINKYKREDMLEYMTNHKIQLAKWDEHRGGILF